MSILKVANIHFEAAGTKRIDYLNDDVLRISFGETVLSGNARFNGNGATKLSVGTTAQRPTGESGLIRFNTQVGSFEGHNGSAWGSIGGAVDLTPANNYSREVGAAANGWANTKLSNATGTFAGSLTITENLITLGNVTLGDASTDTITLNGSTISLGNNQSIDSGTLFIDGANNRVGIGISNLSESFQVNGPIVTSSSTLSNKTSAASFDFIQQFNSARILAWGAVGSTANISFWSGSGNAGATERIRIDPTGNLLINRTTSTVGNNVRLDVNGAINASAVLINGVATGGGTTIFTANLGNNSVNTFNIAHNLNNLFVIPAVREYSSGYYVYPDVKTTTPNHIVIEFVNAPTTNQYAVLIVG